MDTVYFVPDASKSLKVAAINQQKIGWENWMKGRWSIEWAYLFNFDIANTASNVKYNFTEKIVKEIIIYNWEYMKNVWNERNIKERDLKGEPDRKKKEKKLKRQYMSMTNL